MAIPHSYPDQESIPEGLREHYVNDGNGAFRLELTPESRSAGYRVENVDGLTSALQSERATVKALKDEAKRYAPLKDVDMDGDGIKAALDEHRRLKSTESEQVQQLNSTISMLKQARQDDVKAAVTPVEAQRDKAVGALRKVLVSQGLDHEIESQGGSADLLRPALSEQIGVELDWENQEMPLKVFVRGDNGLARLGSDGQPLTIQALVAEAKENPSFARAFDAERQGGPGGFPPSGRPGNGRLTEEQAMKLSDEEFEKAIAERRI